MRIPVVYENPRRRGRSAAAQEHVEHVIVPGPPDEHGLRKMPCGCRTNDPAAGVAVPVPAVPGPFTQVVKDPAKFDAVMARAHAIGNLDNDGAIAALIRPDLEAADQEIFVVVGLDIRNHVRAYTEVARGVRDCAMVGIPDILRAANIDGCTGFVVAHNHPSGDARPSPQDRQITAQIAAGADAVGLIFIDHLVIGSKGSYFTFRDNKLKRTR